MLPVIVLYRRSFKYFFHVILLKYLLRDSEDNGLKLVTFLLRQKHNWGWVVGMPWDRDGQITRQIGRLGEARTKWPPIKG